MTDIGEARLDRLAQLLASGTAPYLAFAVNGGDTEMIALCVVLAERWPQPRTRPDDHVVDHVAVARAAEGEPIPLTRHERLAAVELLAARGVSANAIATRLHMSWASVRYLVPRGEQREAS